MPRPTKKTKVDTAPPPPKPLPSGSTSRQPQQDSDAMIEGDDDDEPFEYDSDADSAVPMEEEEVLAATDDEQEEELDGDSATPRLRVSGKKEVETITIDDDEDDVIELDSDSDAEPPPEPVGRPKGKLTSRKQYQLDVTALVQQYGSQNGEQIKNFARQSDDSVEFTIVHPAFKNGIHLSILTPEIGGYPVSHQSLCLSESAVGADVAQVMEEVAALRQTTDRSLSGMLQYLVSRLILGQPAPYPSASQASRAQDEDDDDSASDGDEELELWGLGGASQGQSPALMAALRKDFKELLAAGFRPGFCRLSELDLIVSVSKKVNSLGVPLRALQAWDSELITGEVRYLVLLLNFGSKYPVDPDSGCRGDVRFRIGISPKYKPSKGAIAAAFRSHSASPYTRNDFDSISLSSPLDSLFAEKFQEILLTRRKNPTVGWAGAEHHCLGPTKTQEVIDKKACQKADKDEKKVHGSYTLPKDPMAKGSKTANNYPMLAFSYLIRRFVMCPRYCLICHTQIKLDIVALKPFVCDSQLCLFQLISLGLGPSLEHEIKTNAPAVDLLIQLAYAAAKEGAVKDDLQPQGLSLEVPAKPLAPWKKGDPTEDFDDLGVPERNAGIAALIMELPPVSEMRTWLTGEDLSDNDRQLGRFRKLADMRGGAISSSAWKLLRWIVASNTSYLKLIEEEDELVQGIPKTYRQFRLVVGSPAKEHLLAQSIKAAQKKNPNSVKYPSLYAWHGSAVKNWHSILRAGLHFKETINGRAYGHGVYFAKEGEVSLGYYAQFATNTWKNADFGIGKMAAICEITNLPSEFVSNNPYFVVDKLDWIQCRYLIVQRGAVTVHSAADPNAASDDAAGTVSSQLTQSVPLDPAHPLLLKNAAVKIPDILPKLEAMDRKLADTNEDLNLSDTELLKEPSVVIEPVKGKSTKRALGSTTSRSYTDVGTAPPKPKDLFVPAGPDILKLIRVLPPPAHPNQGASLTIQREMRSVMAQQAKDGPTECGFYFDPERSNDNIFTWIVELIGFDPDLPIYKDMKAKGVSSLLLEVRFPESYPLSPPFFRVVYPRFLPFAQGGGGHVTAGGSLCLDLLTSDGWSPAYTIPAVLLQIKMAISSTEPAPGRLDPTQWATPYSMSEAVAGFQRAAAAHGWTVPSELAKLTREH